ncbi:hypothetical protein PSENEW3n2_00000835 [Picochlorum sp. SENEW3]|nr:hypothetical protein PSENEW3n2_00000835 [Picochlorum sp. SENEW3]WPT15757.1 hypothetical protein PSENEW3_00000835 [Picochlorum sp. SENEW3]
MAHRGRGKMSFMYLNEYFSKFYTGRRKGVYIVVSVAALLLFWIFVNGQRYQEAQWGNKRLKKQEYFKLASCKGVTSPDGLLCTQGVPRDIDNVELSVMISLFSDPNKYLRHLLDGLIGQSIFCSKVPCETEILMVTDKRYIHNLRPDLLHTLDKFISSYPNAKVLILSRDPGLYSCWNILIQTYASGRYLTNVNMDDSRDPFSWETKIKFLNMHSQISVVSSAVAVVGSLCSWEEYHAQPLQERTIWFGYLSDQNIDTNSFFQNDGQPHNFPHNSPMWRKSIHRQCGYFDPEVSPYSDYHLWIKCCSLGVRFAVLPSTLEIYYRNHASYGRTTRVDPDQDAKALYIQYGGEMSVPCGLNS